MNVLQRSMYEIDTYQERMQDAKMDKERTQVINWAVNYLVCNIMSTYVWTCWQTASGTRGAGRRAG